MGVVDRSMMVLVEVWRGGVVAACAVVVSDKLSAKARLTSSSNLEAIFEGKAVSVTGFKEVVV